MVHVWCNVRRMYGVFRGFCIVQIVCSSAIQRNPIPKDAAAFEDEDLPRESQQPPEHTQQQQPLASSSLSRWSSWWSDYASVLFEYITHAGFDRTLDGGQYCDSVPVKFE